mmetsp:Transcript_29835/g.40978  ORF Transcript_29835/g.40978 Transcript_29835/m.40978 type:complete len:208 (+) Transcript_29835:169-792(+)
MSAKFLEDADKVIESGTSEEGNNFNHRSRMVLSPHQACSFGLEQLIASNSGYGYLVEMTRSSEKLSSLARDNIMLREQLTTAKGILKVKESAIEEAETQYYASDEENGKLWYRIQLLEDKVALLSTENKHIRAENQRLVIKCQQLLTENVQLRADNAQLRAENVQLRADNAQLRSENDYFRSELLELRAQMKEMRELVSLMASSDRK